MQTKGKVRVFRQNDTMETCLCCCVLMVLDYYRRLPEGAKYPTKDMENRLYRMLGYHSIEKTEDNIKTNFIAGTPLTAGAWYLARKGLTVSIYHSEDEFLNNEAWGTPYYSKEIFDEILKIYKYWLFRDDSRMKREKCDNLNGKLLSDYLDQKKLIIAACIADSEAGSVLHGIVLDSWIQGEKEKIFHVCNPATGMHTIGEAELVWRMKTPVGIHFLTATVS